MDDAVDGALRRGGRAPSRKRRRTPRTTPRSSSQGTSIFNSRPYIPQTKKQKTRQNIRRFSSGRTAVLPYFAGTKPTRVRRTGGRASGGRNIGGAFAPVMDPFEMQRATEAAARQQALNAAIEKAAKRGSWRPLDQEELDAAGAFAGAIKEQEAARNLQDQSTSVQQKMAAQDQVQNKAGEELEQAAYDTEERNQMKAAREKLWTDEDEKVDSFNRKAKDYLQEWKDQAGDYITEIDSAARAQSESNPQAEDQLQKFKTKFQADMNKKFEKAEQRVADVKQAYKLMMFPSDRAEDESPDKIDWEPSRKGWKFLEDDFNTDRQEMQDVYTDALSDPSRSSPHRVLNFRKARNLKVRKQYEEAKKDWEKTRDIYNTEHHDNYNKEYRRLMEENPEEEVPVIDNLATEYADKETTPTGLFDRYGEDGVPDYTAALSDVSPDRAKKYKRIYNDVSKAITSQIKDSWTKSSVKG